MPVRNIGVANSQSIGSMSVSDAAIHALKLRVVIAAALHPRPFPFSFALMANLCRPKIRTISGGVLSVHVNSMGVVVKVAAAQHANGKSRPPVTAFDPTTLVKRQSPNREF